MEGEEEKIINITENNKYIIFNKNTSDYEKVSKNVFNYTSLNNFFGKNIIYTQDFFEKLI